MPIGAIIGAVGSLAGGLFGASGQKDAAQIQANAALAGQQLTAQEFQQIQANLLPFLRTGQGASSFLGQYYGLMPDGSVNGAAPFLQPISGTVGAPPSPSDPNLRQNFLASPGYGYQFDEMMRATQNSAAGRTGAISGNTLRSLQTNAQGLASGDWWNYYNQLNNNYGQRYADVANQRQGIGSGLQYLAGSGQSAGAGLGSQGLNAISSIVDQGNLAASAQAAGVLGTNNALRGGFSGAFNTPGIGNALSTGYNYLVGNYGNGGTLGGAGGSGSGPFYYGSDYTPIMPQYGF